MTKLIVRIIVLIVIGFATYFLYQIYMLNFAYNQLSTQADRIAIYFQNLVLDDVQPLSQLSGLSQQDATMLDEIRSSKDRVEKAQTLPDKVNELLSLQGTMWQFLSHNTTPGLKEDTHFADLRRRDNRPSEVYDLINGYNQNVLLFNNRLADPSGKLGNQFFHYDKEKYLTIDGGTEKEQVINL